MNTEDPPRCAAMLYAARTIPFPEPGEQCENEAMPGSDYCPGHSEQLDDDYDDFDWDDDRH